MGNLLFKKRYGKKTFEIEDNYIKVIIPFDEKVLKQQNDGLNLTHSEDKVIKIPLKNSNYTVESIANVLLLTKRTI